MGVVGKGRLADYWSTDETIVTPFFGRNMSRNRYQNILRFFHFANNKNLDQNDRLRKVRHVYDTITSRFSDNYIPGEHLSLDEGILA